MNRLLVIAILNVSIAATLVSGHESSLHQSADELDNHLHMDQIPPPSAQPSHEDIAAHLSQLFADQMDKDGDGFVDVHELKAWIEVVHNKLIADNIEQQWSYYQPEVQEVHSWEGYNPEQQEVLHWDVYVNMTYPDNIGDEEAAHESERYRKCTHGRAITRSSRKCFIGMFTSI
ncbi:unnamed protein product [Medioppia subpectinata]|uniref:EF-hand domain-containing protein n=1 Tax=Medioppia subpectinata TaxID=1979941 RepID=A0A7R9LHP4_9ACAR|nr:unnamed protein product [Medioppia subpectinata]CAG2118331.1 unnamed protein product [Medioppia subpectinata]